MTSLDQRYCYGGSCTWNGLIQEVGNTRTHPAHQKLNEVYGTKDHDLPCCPFCGGMLFQMNSKAEWDIGVASYDVLHPGYAKMWDWQREQNRCFKTVQNLAEAFRLATRIEVKL